MDQPKNYPWEIKPVPEEELAEVDKYRYGCPMNSVRVGPAGYYLPAGFMKTGPEVYNMKLRPSDVFVATFPRSGCPMNSVRVGPAGYYLPAGFMKTGPEVYNMKLRPSDVFVATFPRSGTTWTQELVWLIGNDYDYKRAAEIKLTERFPFVEFAMLFNDRNLNVKITPKTPEETQTLKIFSVSVNELLHDTESPRFIKTHLPMSLLPPTLLETAKVVYVARDPRDVAVSFYHHYQLVKGIGFTGDFKIFWKFFIEDRVNFSPYFPHVKEAWEKRNYPNMLFLFYEELSMDLPAVVRRVARFLEKQITEEQVCRLCDHLHINNFKHNKSVNNEDMGAIGMFDGNKPNAFIRKGKTGGWRSYFDEKMTAQTERWIEDNLRGTDLSFPQL